MATKKQRNEEYVAYGARLTEAMADASMNTVDLSKKTGVDAGNLSKMMNGHRGPGLAKTSDAIASALGVRAAWLIKGDGAKRDDIVSADEEGVHPVIARVGAARGYDIEEQRAATMSVRGLEGTAGMFESVAEDLLARARMWIRDSKRAAAEGMATLPMKREKLPGRAIESDEDLSGGSSAIPKLPSRGGRRR